jgi:hypothetical protein
MADSDPTELAVDQLVNFVIARQQYQSGLPQEIQQYIPYNENFHSIIAGSSQDASTNLVPVVLPGVSVAAVRDNNKPTDTQRIQEQLDHAHAILSELPSKFGSKLYQTEDFDIPSASKGARVPLDKVRDFGFFYEDEGDPGNETISPHPSVQAEQDKILTEKMKPILAEITKIVNTPGFDPQKSMELFKIYDAMKAQSPSFQQSERYIGTRMRMKTDADIIQNAMDSYSFGPGGRGN